MSDREHHHHHRHHHHHHHRKNILRFRSGRGLSPKARAFLLPAVLILTAAFIFGAVSIYERSEKKEVPSGSSEASDYLAEGLRLIAEEDTLDFDGELFGFDHRMEAFLFVGTDNNGTNMEEFTVNQNEDETDAAFDNSNAGASSDDDFDDDPDEIADDTSDESASDTEDESVSGTEEDTELPDDYFEVDQDWSKYPHGGMCDFLLLMVLDYTDDTYGFLQIDRNTMTYVNMYTPDGSPGGEAFEQICTAYWYGLDPETNAENTVLAVSDLLGYLENIKGYYILNMDNIGVLNHAVGGVEVTIDDDLTPTDPDMVKGAQLTLTDEQAERYLRARMNVGGGTNVERMSRQRTYMNSFFSKVKNLSEQKADFYNDLWISLRHAGNTNMNGNTFSRIANMLLKGESKGTLTLEGETIIGDVGPDGERHEEFYPDEESIFKVMNTLYPLIRIPDEDEYEDDSDEDEWWGDENETDEDEWWVDEDETDEDEWWVDEDETGEDEWWVDEDETGEDEW